MPKIPICPILKAGLLSNSAILNPALSSSSDWHNSLVKLIQKYAHCTQDNCPVWAIRDSEDASWEGCGLKAPTGAGE